MVLNSTASSFGIRQALRAAGITPAQFRTVKAASHTLHQHGHADILLAKAAAELFRQVGAETAEAYPIFVKIAALKPEQWSPGYATFTQAFTAACRRFDEGHIKKANPLANAASGLSKFTPAMISTLLTGGLLLGTGTGALSWHLNRDMAEDDINNAQTKEKIRVYRDLADEVNREVQLRKARLLLA